MSRFFFRVWQIHTTTLFTFTSSPGTETGRLHLEASSTLTRTINAKEVITVLIITHGEQSQMSRRSSVIPSVSEFVRFSVQSLFPESAEFGFPEGLWFEFPNSTAQFPVQKECSRST